MAIMLFGSRQGFWRGSMRWCSPCCRTSWRTCAPIAPICAWRCGRAGAGHWIQQERPDETNAALLDIPRRAHIAADEPRFSPRSACPRHFASPYAPDDEGLAGALLAGARLAPEREARIDAEARHLVGAIRASVSGIGGIEALLREYSLTTPEGLALMVLAEGPAARAR